MGEKEKQVLIAEDETSIVTSLSFILSEAGFKIDVASDGKEALAKLKKNPPDVLLLDLMMDHYNGFDVLRILRSDETLCHIKVLVLSAKGQESDRQRVMELGADKFIAKPYSNQEVVACVCALAEK